MYAYQKHQQDISRSCIELGRHQKPYLPVEKRLCQVCSWRKVDSKCHSFIHCGFPAVDRKILYSTACQDIINLQS